MLKIKIFLRVTKYKAMKTHGGVVAQLHALVDYP